MDVSVKTSHGWFDVEQIGQGVWSIAEPGHAEHVHSYLIEGATYVAVLDTGMGVGDFHSLVAELSDREPIVVHSHAHWDHVGASAQFDRLLIHPSEAADLEQNHPNAELAAWFQPEALRDVPLPDSFDVATFQIQGAVATGSLNHGDTVDLGGRVIEIFHTPGHSPGGITVLDPETSLLFPGDAVNLGPIYLFGDQADLRAFQDSIELLTGLASRVERVYPSHYDVPMASGDIVSTRDAFREILPGRIPDETRPGIEIYTFPRFTFLIKPGAVEALR